jgi:hypothetical protein
MRVPGVAGMRRLARWLGLVDSERPDDEQPLAIETLNAYLSAGAYEEGLAFAETLGPKTRALPQIRLRVSRCAAAISRFPIVIAELCAIIDMGGGLPNVRHDLAAALISEGKLDCAAEVLAPVLVHADSIAEIGHLHKHLLRLRGESTS